MSRYLSFSVAALFLVFSSCGGADSPLNTELDPSGTYQMTMEYSDSELEAQLTITRNEEGFLKAEWDYGDEDDSIYENTAVCFGDRYLAICEPGDPPMLDIFTVGEGALNGFWVEYGYEDMMPIHGTTEDGGPLPEPPVLATLQNPGTYSLDGDNPDGSYYVGSAILENFGNVIGVDESITPDYDPEEYYWGVGVIIDDYLVIAVSSFVGVYTPSGDDWHGVITDYSQDVVTREDLEYSGE